ncbi:hypothetical protein EV122DRAFT_252228 [Schizophyllum commune]
MGNDKPMSRTSVMKRALADSKKILDEPESLPLTWYVYQVLDRHNRRLLEALAVVTIPRPHSAQLKLAGQQRQRRGRRPEVMISFRHLGGAGRINLRTAWASPPGASSSPPFWPSSQQDTRDMSQPITDTARVTPMLYSALLTYYAHLDASRKRRTPLAFTPRIRRAGIMQKTSLLLAQEDMTLTPVRGRGRQELEAALKRAAFTIPYLRASPPAVLQAVVDSLSSPDAVALEARSYRREVPGQGSEDPTIALYALITAITYAPRGQAILDAWVAENLVPVMKVIMHIPATLPVVLSTLAHAQEPMVPPPARKRKAALMESPGDVSQGTDAPEFDHTSAMDADSSHTVAIAGLAPAWTIAPRSPLTSPPWSPPLSARDSTTWDAAAPSLDVGTPPWVPIPASPVETSVVQEAGPAWQLAASALRDATPAVRDVDSALREFFSAFHDVGLVFRGDTSYPRDTTSYPHDGTSYPRGDTSGPQDGTSYPQDNTSFPQGDTAYPHDDTSVLDERILPMVDVTSEALNSHWAFWDGDATEDDVMTNLTVWDAQTNSGVALTIFEDEDVSTLLEDGDASTLLEDGDTLTILENAASAFGGVAAVSTPTYKFDAVNSIFVAANSTSGTSNSAFGISSPTSGTSSSTFGISSSTFEVADSTSASATSTSCGDGWVGLSATNHQDLDADVSVVSTATWDTSISAAWDALHDDGSKDDRGSFAMTSDSGHSSSSSIADFSSSLSAASSSLSSSAASSAPSYASSSSFSSVGCGSSFTNSASSPDNSASSPPASASASAARMTCIGGACLRMLSGSMETRL